MIEPRQHGYFKIHSANIYYRIYGAGEKTLFSFMEWGRLDVFQETDRIFAADYKIVTTDSRGHGNSGTSEKSLTIKQIAMDAVSLIGKLHLEDVTLVGFSDGAKYCAGNGAQYRCFL